MQALLKLRRPLPFVLASRGTGRTIGLVRAASDLGTHRVRSPKVHPEVKVAGFTVTAPYARVTEQSVSAVGPHLRAAVGEHNVVVYDVFLPFRLDPPHPPAAR